MAIEIDASFTPCLEDRFGTDPKFQLFRGDVLNQTMQGLENALRNKLLVGVCTSVCKSNIDDLVTSGPLRTDQDFIAFPPRVVAVET